MKENQSSLHNFTAHFELCPNLFAFIEAQNVTLDIIFSKFDEIALKEKI